MPMGSESGLAETMQETPRGRVDAKKGTENADSKTEGDQDKGQAVEKETDADDGSQGYRTLAWALNPRTDHFVVVVGWKPQKVLVMDPAYGVATLSRSHFEGAWSQMKHACLLISN